MRFFEFIYIPCCLFCYKSFSQLLARSVFTCFGTLEQFLYQQSRAFTFLSLLFSYHNLEAIFGADTGRTLMLEAESEFNFTHCWSQKS